MDVHILYENSDWLPPLVDAIEDVGLRPRPIAIRRGTISGTPQPGIYLNRMSPSSHTRGHDFSVALTREYLAWLEMHDARVVNGLDAFELEMSKMRQFMVLQQYGIQTPQTALAVGRQQLVDVAQNFDGPFITKHNRGGKGLGIVLFSSADELAAHLDDQDFDFGPDGQVIVQDYIEPAESHITRVELVGGRMVLAMESSTDEGFQLCPSDVCQVKQAEENPDNCPVDSSGKFRQSPLSEDDPLVSRYIAMCAGEGIEIAGIEFVEDADGNRYTYDINGTTNYNQSLGEEIGVDGMGEVARYLRDVVAPQVDARHH